MAVVTGADGAFLRNNVKVARCRNWSLSVDVDLIDTTPLDVEDREFQEGLRGASGSAVVLYDPDVPEICALFNRILSRQAAPDSFGFCFNTRTGASIEASCFIRSMAVPMSVGEAMATTFQLTTTGSLSGGF